MVDECAGPRVAQWLYLQEHDVISIVPDSRGLDDRSILEWAVADNRIVVTCDKGFGELVFRQHLPHRGVVLLRLDDETPARKIAMLNYLLDEASPLIEGNFVVVNEEAASFNTLEFRYRQAGRRTTTNP